MHASEKIDACLGKKLLQGIQYDDPTIAGALLVSARINGRPKKNTRIPKANPFVRIRALCAFNSYPRSPRAPAKLTKR